MSFEIRPLSDALGAEVLGLDLREPLDDETFAAVHRAHLAHLVLVFRDQQLTPQQQIDFSKRFGPLDQHPADDAVLPDYPDILVVSTKRKDGKYIGLPDGGPMWHSDLAYKPRPALGSMLYALEIPDAGGNTGFANMYKAYDALSESMKARLDGLRAAFIISRKRFKDDNRIKINEDQADQTPEVTHPVVRIHPETERKALYVNPGHTDHIIGMDAAESRALLDELHAHSTRPEFIYRHKWRLHDLVFWDNRCLIHIADPPKPGFDRHMHRTTIEGDRPY